MKISIIIPTTARNKDYCDTCVNSFKTDKFEYEILIALNGKDTDFPQGQCAAVNRMAKQATGDYLFVVNDDMYFPEGWDKFLEFKHDCFSLNMIEPTDNAGSAHPFLKLDAGIDLEHFNKEKVDELMREHTDTIVENGFNLPFFIKRDLWDFIGGYDEAYDPWGSNSDSDLQYKLEVVGIQPKRYRGSLIYHFGGKSGTFAPERQEYWNINWNYFINKWGFEREDSPMIWDHQLHVPLEKYKEDSWTNT